MTLSVLGIALNYTLSSPESKFKNTKFKQVNNLWVTYKDKQKISIVSTPQELESIPVPDITFSDLNKASKIYFTTNSEDAIPYETLLNIQNNIVPKLNSLSVACTQDSEKCANLPLKTCLDTTPTTAVIQLQIAETPIITFENNCLLIQAPRDSLTRYVDALILRLYNLT